MSDRTPDPPAAGDRILLFDGICVLCSGWVDFVIRYDPTARVKLASVQSDPGQRLLEWSGLSLSEFDTMVFIDGGRTHLRSSAFLRVVRYLRFPWPLLSVGLLVPRPLRDWLYNEIATHRYEWFGRREVCRVPTADLAAHFLEEAPSPDATKKSSAT